MSREHRVRITWSDAQVRRGLPGVPHGTDPVWLDGLTPAHDKGWSFMYRFEILPREQGNPSEGWAKFLFAQTAPQEWLQPGCRLRLFERGTGDYAQVKVLD